MRHGQSCPPIQKQFQDLVVVAMSSENEWGDVLGVDRRVELNCLPTLRQGKSFFLSDICILQVSRKFIVIFKFFQLLTIVSEKYIYYFTQSCTEKNGTKFLSVHNCITSKLKHLDYCFFSNIIKSNQFICDQEKKLKPISFSGFFCQTETLQRSGVILHADNFACRCMGILHAHTSQHYGIENHHETPHTSKHYGIKGFKGGPQLCPIMPRASRAANV